MTGGKKIVRVIARLNIGGPAIHTVLLSGELNKRGWKDILVCGRVGGSEGDMTYLAGEMGVAPIVIPELSREIAPLSDLKAFMELFRIMRREKPDIVHTHTAKAGTLGRLAALCAGVPIRIHTFHGHIFDGYFSPAKERAFLLAERFLARFTDRIITVSELVRDEIVNKLKVVKAAKCVAIPLGFELKRFLACESLSGAFRKELGVGADTLLVGIVGRLVPIKNHAMFLDVAGKVLARGRGLKVKFVIVGDGECGDSLKAQAKLMGLDGHTVFTGWRRDLAAVYADLDIVALTSLNEGTPVSVIEAMASGRSVVATDVGGVADLITDGENGYLAKSNDPEGFSNIVIGLLADRDMRIRLGARGRERVRVKYSKERLLNDMESLYNDCLKTA